MVRLTSIRRQDLYFQNYKTSFSPGKIRFKESRTSLGEVYVLYSHANCKAEASLRPPVGSWFREKWKDPLTNEWKGPDPVLIWGRGSVCVFSRDEDGARWPMSTFNNSLSHGVIRNSSFMFNTEFFTE